MTQTEGFVVDLCSRMLAHDALTLDDDLRSVGAESMFFVELAAEVEDAFGIFVPVEDVEACVSAREIAAWISATKR